MKYLSIVVLIIMLISCKINQDNSVKNETKQLSNEKLKKNEFYAIVGQRRKAKTDDSLKETILLINERKYFIKFSEGYVSEEKILQHLNKRIKIKGEIKQGSLEPDTPGSLLNQSQHIKGRTGEYIIIHKIISE